MHHKFKISPYQCRVIVFYNFVETQFLAFITLETLIYTQRNGMHFVFGSHFAKEKKELHCKPSGK